MTDKKVVKVEKVGTLHGKFSVVKLTFEDGITVRAPVVFYRGGESSQ